MKATDALYPPPIEATHFDGAISDSMQRIVDALSVTRNRDRGGSISDTAKVIRDSVTAALINLETPARWVAPITITPRVSAIDPLYLAAHPVRHPTIYFDPKVKSYGTFTRAISAPAGFIKTGDVNITLLDLDNSLRQQIASKTIRKATAEVRLGPEGASLSAFLRPCKREVGTITQPSDGLLSMPLRDYVYDSLENQIPAEVDATRYPNLPESPARDFSPIIIGTVAAANGAIPLFLVDTANFGYLVARHPCKSIDAVYRKASDEDEFSLVDPSEYTVENVWLQHCIINFSADQADAEIRADVTGYYDADTLALKCTNFSDFILEILQTILGVEGLDRINFASFEETKTRTTAAGLACAGMLKDKMTFGELLTQLQRSSNIDIFSDKNDRITVHYTTDDEEPTVDLDDILRLYKGTVSQSLADPAYNQIPYKYAPNYATDKWTEAEWNNEGDQEKIGDVVPDEQLQLYWIRDAATALSVVERRGQYLDLDSFRFEGEIPLIPVLENLELADLVEIAHFGGIKSGGYTEEQFKILELSMDIDNLKYKFKGIRRRLPPPTAVAATLSGNIVINARVGPFAGTEEGELFAIFRNPSDDKKLKAWYTNDYGATWAATDDANAPSLANGISSFDCYKTGNLIYIATQESSGRVAYHVFSITTGTWLTVNDEVITTVSNGGSHCVSIECRYPDLKPVIYFQGNKELIGGQYWHRGYYSILQSGSWSSPAMVTPDPGQYSENLYGIWRADAVSSHCYIQRVVAGRENRMHFFWTVNPAVTWVQWSPDEYCQTMQSDLTLGGKRLIATTSVYYPAARNIGGVIAFDNRSKIAMVRKSGSGGWGSAFIDIYSEGPSLERLRETATDGTIYESVSAAENPAGFVGVDEDGESPILYLASACWGPRYVSVQESTDAGAVWTAQVQAGPLYAYPQDIQTLAGNFFKIRGRMYLAYFSGPTFPMFRWKRVDKLPSTT